MLQKIRDRVQGWIASTILLLLVIPFAFWGINYYFGNAGEVSIVSVGERDVALRDFQRSLQNLRQRFVAATEGKIPVDDEMLRKQTIESLVNRELIANAAGAMDLRVGDGQIRSAIENVGAFQGANGFDRVVYESALAQMGLSPSGFETQVRGDLVAEQLQTAVVGTVFTVPDEVRAVATLRKQTRDLRYAVLSADAAKEGADVAEADIKEFYASHQDEFRDPEQVKVAYLRIALQDLADKVQVDDAALEAWYQDNSANYTVAEQREIRQALVPLPENATDADAQAALARAQAIADRVRAGTRLADVIAAEEKEGKQPLEFSEFGYLGRGVLDAEIEDAVFGTPAGQVAGPLKSKYGIHVVEVGQIKASTANTFADVRAEVEKDYRHAEAAKGYAELSDRLATLTYEHPDGLDIAAEELGLRIEESSLFTREQPPGGVLSAPQALAAAFSEEVLVNHNNSELLELDGDVAIVLRVVEHVPAAVRPLEQVQERIVTRLRFERARAAVEKKGAALLAELTGGADPDALAQRENITWEASNDVTREDPGVNRAVLRAAFSAGQPAGGKPLFQGVSLGTGDYALVMVTEVKDPAPDSFSKEDLEAVKNELLQSKSGNGWTRYIKELRGRTDVVVREDLLQ